jgi:hypothetical protein
MDEAAARQGRNGFVLPGIGRRLHMRRARRRGVGDELEDL